MSGNGGFKIELGLLEYPDHALIAGHASALDLAGILREQPFADRIPSLQAKALIPAIIIADHDADIGDAVWDIQMGADRSNGIASKDDIPEVIVFLVK